MKIRSTLIALSLVFGLFACSYNSGVLKEAQPTSQNATLKSSAANNGKMTMHFKGMNNFETFDSAGGLLTQITAVRKGNVKLGIKEKRIVIWNTPEQFDDLLYMGTGMMSDLVLLNIPTGVYDYVIVNVSQGWAAKDGHFYPVKFPGNRMILHFNPPVTVGEHLSPDLYFLIDVSRSFVPIAGGKAYIFKPVVQVVNATETGSLAGAVVDVTNYQPITHAFVYLDVNGTQYSGYTATDTTVTQLGDTIFPGQYWIPGIPPGTYTAHAEKDNYVTASATVSIMKGNYFFQNFGLMPK